MSLAVTQLIGFGVGDDALTLTFVASAVVSSFGGGTTTFALPTGTQAGDIMLGFVATPGTSSHQTGHAYSMTELWSNTYNSANTYLYWLYRIADGTEASTSTATYFMNSAASGIVTFRPSKTVSSVTINGATGDTRNGADPTSLSLDMSAVSVPALKVACLSGQSVPASVSVSPSMTLRSASTSRWLPYADFYGSAPVSQTTFDQGSGTNVGQALAYLTFA